MAGFDLQRVFDIAGTALNAQSVRMNTIASNLANVGSEASSEAEAFRAKRAVFEALLRKEQLHQGAPVVGAQRGISDDPTPSLAALTRVILRPTKMATSISPTLILSLKWWTCSMLLGVLRTTWKW